MTRSWLVPLLFMAPLVVGCVGGEGTDSVTAGLTSPRLELPPCRQLPALPGDVWLDQGSGRDRTLLRRQSDGLPICVTTDEELDGLFDTSTIRVAPVLPAGSDPMPAHGGEGKSDPMPAQGGENKSDPMPAQGGENKSDPMPAHDAPPVATTTTDKGN